jgi:hypothetical protein
MPDYNRFVLYCYFARERFNVRGILIYRDAAQQPLTVAGWPYPRISAHNDNGAEP